MKMQWWMGLLLMGSAVQSNALDLVEAYERAKQADPNWQAQRLQYEADQLNLGIAGGNLLPTVSVAGNITRKNQSLDLPANSQYSNFLSSTTTSQQLSLTLRQPLFRWDAWQGYKQVKTSVQLSEVNLQLQQQQHVLELAERYFNVLRQQALSLAYVQEEQALLAQLNMMNAKLKEGLLAQSDVSEANAQYQSAQANRIASQVQILLAQEQLAEMIGPYQENLAVLRPDFQFQRPIPSDLDSWASLAQTNNLEIIQARLQSQYAEDAKRVEQAARYPQIDAVGTYGYSKQSPETIMSTNGDFDQVGVEVNWNLFNGGQVNKKVRQAGVKVTQSLAQLDSAKRKANSSVKQAFLQVETDQAKLNARRAAQQSSDVVSAASKAQYQEGLKNMVDVLLAQRNAFSAKTDYLNAQYDYLLHVLQLHAAVGQLNQSKLTELNAWLLKSTP